MNNLRATALRNRRQLDPETRLLASEIICKKAASTRLFRSASNIACYLPMRDEVDTLSIIARAWRANKRVFVPVLRNKREMFFREIRPNTTLQRNSLSIWEPESGEIISPRLLQVVITPTVAFDKFAHRIGMGGGYYDRCFAFLRHRVHWQHPKLLGVAFKCQEVEEISPNAWDVPLYCTICETD